MKPEAPLSNDVGPEQQVPRQKPNVGGETLKAPELGVEKSAESFEKSSEHRAAVADASSGVTTVIPTPVPPSQTTSGGSVTIGDPNPIVANDDDLIEKEWVDRAKKIVSETKDDPYQRDEEVGKLQVDYLKKRFGRELGGAE
jgi:hypothetical protein